MYKEKLREIIVENYIQDKIDEERFIKLSEKAEKVSESKAEKILNENTEYEQKSDNIFYDQSNIYVKNKCSKLKLNFSKEGRKTKQICLIRAKLYGAKKALTYLKSISTKDPLYKKHIGHLINDKINFIKANNKHLSGN